MDSLGGGLPLPFFLGGGGGLGGARGAAPPPPPPNLQSGSHEYINGIARRSSPCVLAQLNAVPVECMGTVGKEHL